MSESVDQHSTASSLPLHSEKSFLASSSSMSSLTAGANAPIDPPGVTCRVGEVDSVEDFEFVNEAKFAVFNDEQLDRSLFNEEEEKKLTREAMRQRTVFIAELEGKKIGLIWFIVSNLVPYGVDYGKHFNKFAWVSFIWVDPEARRLGIGKYLYRKVEEYCKEQGIPEIMLDVFLNNPRSLSFHKSMGFEPFLQIYSKKIE